LRNVQPSWIAFGWFVALSVTSAAVLLFAASGALDHGDRWTTAAIAVAVAIGWAAGGFVIGFKTAAAPILHGAAIALFTFIAWFVLNLVFGGVTTGTSAWEPMSIRGASLVLLVQGGAAIGGCWFGYRYAPARVE